MSKEKYRASTRDTESVASFDSTGKQKSFRRLITRFAEKTSMQGVPYINMAKFWWAKVIWAMLLSLAIVVMVLHLWYLFDQWYSWPKTTKITLGFDKLAFPQVTICNANVLHKSRFNKFNGADKLKLLVDDLKPERLVPDQFDDEYDPYAGNGGNQQDGTEQNGNQSTTDGGTQKNGNLSTTDGGTEQNGNQQDGNEQNGNQSPTDGGTGQNGNHSATDGGTGQNGNHSATDGGGGENENQSPTDGRTGQNRNQSSTDGGTGHTESQSPTDGGAGQNGNQSETDGGVGQNRNQSQTDGGVGQNRNQSPTDGGAGQNRNKSPTDGGAVQNGNQSPADGVVGQNGNQSPTDGGAGQSGNQSPTDGGAGQNGNQSQTDGEVGQSGNQPPTDGGAGQNGNQSQTDGGAGQNGNQSPSDGGTGQNGNQSPTDGGTGQNGNHSPTDGGAGQNGNQSTTDGGAGPNGNQSTTDGGARRSGNQSSTDGGTGQNGNQSPTDGGTGQNGNQSPTDGGTGQNGNQSPTDGGTGHGNQSPTDGGTGQNENQSPTDGDTGQSENRTTKDDGTEPTGNQSTPGGGTGQHGNKSVSAGPGSDRSPDEQNPAPNIRRKRFVNNYDNINFTKYDSDYRPDDASLYTDFNSPIDSQMALDRLFSELYMDIENLFKLHQTSEYGNCWTISSDRFTVRRAGPSGGLSVILFLETNEYLKGLTTGYGARIQIQKQNAYPFPFDEGTFVSGSAETDIGLKMTTITRLAGSYGSCDDGKEFGKLYNLTYTRRACQSFCRITAVITKCACYGDQWEEFAFSKDKTLKPCRSDTEIQCEQQLIRQYQDGTRQCTCENPCSETVYVKSLSQRQWPTDAYSRVLLDWICNKDPATCKRMRNSLNNIWVIKNNFLKLNIYYEDLNFENVTEVEQIELQQFLSDIGGAVGLWIGLSMLSLCELIQVIIELCDYGVNKAVKGGEVATHRRQRRVSKSLNKSDDQEKGIDSPWSHRRFAPIGIWPRHVRDESPYTENDKFSHSSDRESDDYRRKRNGNDFNTNHCHRVRSPGDDYIPGESPYFIYNGFSQNPDRGSECSGRTRNHDDFYQKLGRHIRSQDDHYIRGGSAYNSDRDGSPRVHRRGHHTHHREPHEHYSDRDDFGYDRSRHLY